VVVFKNLFVLFFLSILLAGALFFSAFQNNNIYATTSPIHQQTVSSIATNTASVVTPSVNGGTNQLYLVAVNNYLNVNVNSVTGLGLTWSEIKAQCASANTTGIEIWKAFGSPSSGTVTVNFTSTTQAATVSVSRYSGADPANPVSGAIGENTVGLNGACSGGTTNANLKLTLTSAQNNTTLYTASGVRMRTITIPDPDYTERANNIAGTVEKRTRLYIHDRAFVNSGSDTLNQTLSDKTDWVAAGVVINPSGGGPTPTPTPTVTPTPSPTVAPTPTPTQPPVFGGPDNPEEMKIKLMVVINDPILENFGGVRLHNYYSSGGWNDPSILTNLMINDLNVSSHGIAKYEIVEIIVRDEWLLHENGQRYTDEQYINETNNGNWTMGCIDYNDFINRNGIEQKVNDGNVDEVWQWAGPGEGCWESAMAGNGAYWINGNPVNGVNSKAFVIMGLNFERGMPEALESYGHRAESIIRRNYDGWHIFPGEGQVLHDWDAFTAQERWEPGLGGVGTAHDPFNAPFGIDYIRDSQVYASTNAADWFNFPDMTGDRQTKNCLEWGCSSYEWFIYWYSHMPFMAGIKDKALANWWRYIADVESYKTGYLFNNPTAFIEQDLTENNASTWSCWAEEGTCSLTDDNQKVAEGASSVKFDTDGPFDTWVRYPTANNANWNLNGFTSLSFSAYAINSNESLFQGPIVIYLKNNNGSFFRYESSNDSMNSAINNWKEFNIPLTGSPDWVRTTSGTPSMSDIDQIEIHNDTWGAGFTIYFDGLGFIKDIDLAENNASSWSCWAEGALCSLENYTGLVKTGASSIRFVTDGGFDTYFAYPAAGNANLNLNGKNLVFWAYAQNASPNDFQNRSPWIILKDANGNYFKYQADTEKMNLALDRWQRFTIPLSGDSVWKRTKTGNISLNDIDQVEFHNDTWDYGFIIHFDGVHFEKLDTLVPDVLITNPLNNSNHSGNVPIKVTATDNSVVNRVDFFLDGQYLGTDALPPYIFEYNAIGGTHTLNAKALDFAGNEKVSNTITVNPVILPTPTASPTPSVTPTATPTTPPSTLTLQPSHDSFVKSDVPTTNFGTNTVLKVKAGSISMKSLLKFDVNGITSQVQSAKIRLNVSDASSVGGTIFLASNNYLGTTTPWVESGLNWNNTPEVISPAYATVGNAALNNWVEFDVTPAITGNGIYSFIITSTSTDAVFYQSSEASSNKPELVVLLGTGTPQPTPTVTPTSIPTSTPSATPTPAGNLVVNPGFELDTNTDSRPDNWTSNAKFTKSGVIVRSENFSGRHLATDNSGWTISQIINGISAGGNYNFGGWVNIPTTSDAFTFSIKITWQNSSGSNLSTVLIKSYTVATAGVWNEVTKAITAPTGATKAVVKMVVSSLNATIYVDDFSLTAI